MFKELHALTGNAVTGFGQGASIGHVNVGAVHRVVPLGSAHATLWLNADGSQTVNVWETPAEVTA